ncbi:MAG: 4-(cytidine 5'-diphospho)-2-C-methyl-D-erythritol kinase [Planctomycetota bacterium]
MRIERLSGGGVRLFAPAKVNLFLEVLARRPDDYHDIETVMAPLALFDVLEAHPAPLGVSLEIEGGEGIPAGESNLVLRAWRAAEQAAGRTLPARLRLRKRIPAGAGMGGGSSDAAAALQAAAALHGLDPSALPAAAASVGSDVPFFLGDGFALCTGRGERIEPCPSWPDLWIVAHFPGFPCPTATVYRRHDERFPLTPDPRRASVLLHAIGNRDLSALRRSQWNRLEAAVFSDWPHLQEIRDTMATLGEAPVHVTGSGSALFGVFGHAQDAREAEARLRFRGFKDVFCAPADAGGDSD